MRAEVRGSASERSGMQPILTVRVSNPAVRCATQLHASALGHSATHRQIEKALDQRHTYPLHCLPKSTNHFQYRKWRNRLQKVVEKQVLPIFPVQYTSLLSQWGYNNKATSEVHLLTDLPLLNAVRMNSSRERAIPLVR